VAVRLARAHAQLVGQGEGLVVVGVGGLGLWGIPLRGDIVEEPKDVCSVATCHAAEGDHANLKLCQRGEWQDPTLVEAVLSMLTMVCHGKRVMHRMWASFHARLAFTLAAFNVLVQWHGFQPYASGFVPVSMAEFSQSV
jgi:hypothetical protein